MTKKVWVYSYEEVDKIYHKPEGSQCWIQWKGTDVCMDFECHKCDTQSHIDAEFTYFIKCPKCGTVYSCSPYVELVEIENIKKSDNIDPIIGEQD